MLSTAIPNAAASRAYRFADASTLKSILVQSDDEAIVDEIAD